MAKMTLSGLQTFVTSYIASNIAASPTYTASFNNGYGLLDKIAKTITIDGVFNDPLKEMDGDDLPLGKTIEEYFLDLTMPVDEDPNGATTMAPHDPAHETTTYSYSCGKKTIPTTERYNDLERCSLNADAYGAMISQITKRLVDSYTFYTFTQKKQLLANIAAKARAATNKATLVSVLPIPNDEASGEAFIKSVKTQTTNAAFPNGGNNLGNYLIGIAPSLTLYVKKGVMSSLDVDTMAGAFHLDKLAIPARIQEVDDFGNDDKGAYAILLDPRGAKLHRGYHDVLQQLNAQGGFMNFYDHSENTAFVSTATFVHIYQTEALA